MAGQARITTQMQLGYVPHSSVSGEAWTLTRRGTATSNGAAGGTTVIDSSVGGSDDDYNGRYWIQMTSGTYQGQRKRVVDYTSASGTFTLENNGFDGQIDSGDTYDLWLSPEPVVVVDSSSGETNMVDATRTESAFYWSDYYAVPITGTHRGKAVRIDETNGSGTFTLDTGLGSALAVGDVVLIRRFVETSPPQLSLTEEYNPRPGNRVNFSMGDGIVGPRSGTVSFNVQARGSGALAADSSNTARNDSGGLLEACGLEEQSTTAATVQVGTGSTTTAIKIPTAGWEGFSIGQAVQWKGNVAFITGMTDGGGGEDTLTVTPALPAAPAAADLLYALRSYSKSTDGDVLGCTIEVEVDGVRTTMTGCKGNVTLQGEGVLELAFNFNVDDWAREIEAAPYNAGTAYPTAPATLTSDRIAYLDTTKTNVGGVTATAGVAVAPRNVQGSAGRNGRCGFQLTGYTAGGTWRELLDSSTDLTQELRWTVRTAKDLMVVWGANGSAVALRVPVARHIESPHPSDAGGMQDVPCVYEAQDAGTANDGGGTAQKMPDWTLHIA